MLGFLWVLMMLVWLAGLGFGLWWVWPHFERMELTGELVGALIWLVIGVAAWVVALNFGRQRFWPR